MPKGLVTNCGNGNDRLRMGIGAGVTVPAWTGVTQGLPALEDFFFFRSHLITPL